MKLAGCVLCRTFHEFLDENLWIRWFVLIQMVYLFRSLVRCLAVNFGADTFQFCIWNGIVHDQLLENGENIVCRHFLCGKLYANLFYGYRRNRHASPEPCNLTNARLVAQTRIDKNGVRATKVFPLPNKLVFRISFVRWAPMPAP